MNRTKGPRKWGKRRIVKLVVGALFCAAAAFSANDTTFGNVCQEFLKEFWVML